jgi:pimeloyl-ACP methyl ester carboxylesterase
MVGMRLALSARQRVGRLVLACTSARFGVPAEWRDRASLVRGSGMQAVAYDALDKWFTPGFGDRERFLDMQQTKPAEDYALGLAAIGSFDVRSELGSVNAPTLVISGAEDTATPPVDGAYLAERIPRARHLVIPDAAHLANVEQADVFNEAVLMHLAQ